VENLSHEHVGEAPDVEASRETARPKRIAVEPSELQKKLPDVADEPPPPGLWTKLEAQLRREGIIR
jgi:hypothetical protein